MTTTFSYFLMPLNAVMWSIVIGDYYTNQLNLFWTIYLLKSVMNILCPAFGIVGFLLVLNVVTYTSVGQIDFRVIYSYMLASVKIVTGELIHIPNYTFQYWAIADIFYLRIRSPRGNPRHLRYYIDRTPATYLLMAFVFLAFTESAWLCLEALLVDIQTITTPITDDDCSGYTCLRGLTPVSCNDVLNITEKETIHCVLFRIQYNIYHSVDELVTAVFLYIAAAQVLKLSAIIVAVLLVLYQTKVWGVALLIIHILLFIGILVFAIEVESIELLNKAKLTSIPILLLPMDFLLLSGGIKTVIQAPQRTRCLIVKPKYYFKGVHHMNTLAGVLSPQSEV